MRPNAKQLALRDPALAALLGITAVAGGADFGNDFGDDFGDDVDLGDDDDYGAEGDFGAAPVPSSAQLAAQWKRVQARKMAQRKRVHLLAPNKGSPMKIEKYIFSLSQQVVVGTAVALAMVDQPDCTFRPMRFSMIVPTPAFATLTQIRVANVNAIIGAGVVDAFQFNANGVGQSMDLPTMSPSTRARITGNYTGFAGGLTVGNNFDISGTFIGPATLAGA